MSAQTPEPAQNAVKRRYRRFTAQDIEDIATLNARRLSDTESCELLGIKYISFRSWKCKSKNELLLSNAITRARAVKLDACLKAIDEAGDSAVIKVGDKEIERRGDWRAKAWIAEQVLAPERFNTRQQPAGNAPALLLNESALDAITQRIIAFRQAKQPAIDCQVVSTESKQIEQGNDDKPG